MLRQIFIPILIIATVVLAYMGAYKPFKKASMYIQASANARSQTSIIDIEEEFNKAFEYPSPVGYDESVKFFLNNVLSIFPNQVQNKKVADEFLRFSESKISKDNFLHILSLANMYNIAWKKFGAEKYFKGAEKYYLKAHEMGPKVPQPLHSLYSIYTKHGDTKKAQEIEDKILELWPEYGEDLGGLEVILK